MTIHREWSEKETKDLKVKKGNTMKKLIAILLVVLVAGVAFGDGTFTDYSNTSSKNDLELTTTVGGRYGLKVTASVITSLTPAGFISAEDIDSIVFTENGDGTVDPETFYINYMTNQRIAAAVTALASPLEGATAGNTSTINYSVAANGATFAVNGLGGEEGAAGPNTVTLFAETGTVNGMRVISESFTITMDPETWELATQDDYSTTWNISLTVN